MRTMTGMPNNPHRESLSEAMHHWREWQSTTCTESSIRQRADVVERLREHTAASTGRAPADVDPRDLTAEEIASYLARPLSRNSKAMYFRSLASWFGWLHRTGRRRDDPTVALAKPRAEQGVPRTLTADEVAAVFAGASSRLVAMMALALYAGLRAHEIARFRGDQIRDGQILVTGKGGKTALLPLHPQLAQLARRMPAGWWFPSSRRPDGHVSANLVSTVIAVRFREVGIASGSGHRLRHTFLTLAHRRIRDIRVTQELARHSSVATTMIYTQVDDADLRAAISGLPDLCA